MQTGWLSSTDTLRRWNNENSGRAQTVIAFNPKGRGCRLAPRSPGTALRRVAPSHPASNQEAAWKEQIIKETIIPFYSDSSRNPRQRPLFAVRAIRIPSCCLIFPHHMVTKPWIIMYTLQLLKYLLICWWHLPLTPHWTTEEFHTSTFTLLLQGCWA